MVDSNYIRFSMDDSHSFIILTNSSVGAKVGYVVEATMSNIFRFVAMRTSGKETFSVQFSNLTLIDLTKMFGSDNGIASALGITVAEITANNGIKAFNAFRRLFPASYYAHYGHLIPPQFSPLIYSPVTDIY